MKRDFTEDVYSEMVSTIQSVDADGLAVIPDTIGDIFSRFQHWIGILNIENYLENVSTYHAKVLDAHNTTIEDLDRIFSNVEEQDNIFQNEMEKLLSSTKEYQQVLQSLCSMLSLGVQYLPASIAARSGKVDTILSTANATVSSCYNGQKPSDIVSLVKENYSQHGWIYDISEYGKCTATAVKGVIKIVGGVSALFIPGGQAIAALGLISAGNDIINAASDAAYIYTDQYDEVGTHNILKDTLIEGYGELGDLLGNRETGEMAGELVYTGIDIVSFLEGAGDMLKSYGVLEADLGGGSSYSPVWGEISVVDDIVEKEFKWYKPKELIRSFFMDASSTVNLIYEAVDNTVSTYKDGAELASNLVSVLLK